MNRIRTALVAGLAGVAMLTASSLVAPVEAHAGGKAIGAAILGGIITGAIISSAARSQPVYQSCWDEKRVVGYDQWGRQLVQIVRVCQ